jgi:hypothetical protein
MRKRHQAILISSNAKKNICNEISLNYDSYEIEQRHLLNNYFQENISPEDISPSTTKEIAPENVDEEVEEENENLEDSSDSEEDIISINSKIKVPPLGEDKGPYIKYEISEKAFVAGINYDDYTIIPENKINIKSEKSDNINNNNYKNKNEEENKQDNRTIKIGQKIEFNDILKQIAYWSEQINLENSKDKDILKNKKKLKDIEIPDVNILQMFKLYPKKLEKMNEKIKIIEKEMKDKNINNDNCVMNKLINDQENIINNKIQNINKLSQEIDNIKSITYGDNFSLIEFK